MGRNNYIGLPYEPEYLISVGRGEVPGETLVHVEGRGLLGTTLSPINNALIFQAPTTLKSLEIVSDNAADNASGSGAREYVIITLDTNWEVETQIITAHATDGTIAVPVPNQVYRLIDCYVSKSGSYANQTTGSHKGNLTIRELGGGATWGKIPITPFPESTTALGVYSVPAGKTAELLRKSVYVDGSKTANIYFFKREGADTIAAPFSHMELIQKMTGVIGYVDEPFRGPRKIITGPADVGFMGRVAVGTAEVTGHFLLLLKDI